MATAAILNSRQSLRPGSGTPWVRATLRAVEWVRQSGYTLISSTGLQTWELVSASAVMKGITLRLLVSGVKNGNWPSGRHEINRRFELNGETRDIIEINDRCEMESLPLASGQAGKDNSMRERDRQVVASADILLPVSISPSGNMAGLIEEHLASGKQVMRTFDTKYELRHAPLHYRIDPTELNPDLERFAGTHVIHWTRATNSAWPNESLLDYYGDVIGSPVYPRTALDTLLRMATSRSIIASARHMPGHMATVSFCAQPPGEAIKLMRWRSRHRVMSFEPYGVGILSSAAEREEIRRVRYFQKEDSETIAGCQPWLTQSRGVKTDWTIEREYRHLGELDLGRFSHDEITLFCRTPDEAEFLRDRVKYEVIAMTR